MGMDRKVTLPAGAVPAWPTLVEFLAARNFPVKLMMIDGQLSFPDEQPPDSWRELRVQTPSGMVTLRREDDGVRLVTWGNAEGPLLQAWNALTWAIATAFGGIIQEEGTARSAQDFARLADLPAGLTE
jgi:hypothetical protein